MSLKLVYLDTGLFYWNSERLSFIVAFEAVCRYISEFL